MLNFIKDELELLQFSTRSIDACPELNLEIEKILIKQIDEEIVKLHLLVDIYREKHLNSIKQVLKGKEPVDNLQKIAFLEDYIHKALWVVIRDRYNVWDISLGIRKGGVLVKTNK